MRQCHDQGYFSRNLEAWLGKFATTFASVLFVDLVEVRFYRELIDKPDMDRHSINQGAYMAPVHNFLCVTTNKHLPSAFASYSK
jgi:hypothetical protein